jgi:4,5-DOPA dioxygenase extradiol
MKRRNFLQTLAAAAAAGAIMSPKDLFSMTEKFGTTERMPVLFVGHGSPMNAIQENEFTEGWRKAGEAIPKPNAILAVSAHWETRDTYVTAMKEPPTIHDFGGFPQELYNVQYPAPGSPELADAVIETVKNTDVRPDEKWGLDHGTWSVVRHMYPKADIPVVQLSLDYYKNPEEHYKLAKELAALRKKGVLIIGSGNIVHNLRMVAWDKMEEIGYGFDWVHEANDKVKKLVLERDHKSLMDYQSLGTAVKLAVPTPEHFLPLLYTVALQEADESASFFNDKPVAGSLSMTSVKIE